MKRTVPHLFESFWMGRYATAVYEMADGRDFSVSAWIARRIADNGDDDHPSGYPYTMLRVWR